MQPLLVAGAALALAACSPPAIRPDARLGARSFFGAALAPGREVAVTEVVRGSPAAACLAPGDVVILVDDRPAACPSTEACPLADELARYEPGTEVRLRVRRGEQFGNVVCVPAAPAARGTGEQARLLALTVGLSVGRASIALAATDPEVRLAMARGAGRTLRSALRSLGAVVPVVVERLAMVGERGVGVHEVAALAGAVTGPAIDALGTVPLPEVAVLVRVGTLLAQLREAGALAMAARRGDCAGLVGARALERLPCDIAPAIRGFCELAEPPDDAAIHVVDRTVALADTCVGVQLGSWALLGKVRPKQEVKGLAPALAVRLVLLGYSTLGVATVVGKLAPPPRRSARVAKAQRAFVPTAARVAAQIEDLLRGLGLEPPDPVKTAAAIPDDAAPADAFAALQAVDMERAVRLAVDRYGGAGRALVEAGFLIAEWRGSGEAVVARQLTCSQLRAAEAVVRAPCDLTALVGAVCEAGDPPAPESRQAIAGQAHAAAECLATQVAPASAPAGQ